MSNLLSTRLRRGLAAGVATLVGAGALTVVGSTAAQAAPTGALTWGVSEQYFDHLSTRVADGGVTIDAAAKTFTFPEASTSVANGVTTVDYSGSIRAAFAMGGTEYYFVKVADPSVQIAADGTATISATVSSKAPAQGATPAEDIAPVEVTVVTLPSTGDLATGYTAGTATAGSFDPEFFDGLAAGVEAHFKQTGTAEQPKKRPAGFNATATAPAAATPKVTVSTQVNGTHAVLTIKGTGFTGGNADYNGIYVGVAETGKRPDLSSQESMDLFAGSDWIPSGQIVNGAFTKQLSVARSYLKQGTKYSLYTWQAHKHSTEALDTETGLGVLVPKPVVIVKKAPAITLKWKKKSTAARAGTISFAVKKTAAKAATGKATFKITYTKKVVVKVKKGKKTIKKKVTKTFVKTVKNRAVKNGVIAKVAVPKNTKKIVVSYTGDTYYKKGSKKLKR